MKQCLTTFLLAGTLCATAQKYYNDAQLWAGVYLEKRLNDRFRLHFKHQSRITQNISWYDRAYLAAGASCRFTRWFRIRTDYAFVEKRRSSGIFSPRHQIRASLIFKYDAARWRFVFRNMSQFKYNEPLSDVIRPLYFNRSKLTVKYEATKRLTFYASGELFVPVYNWEIKRLDRTRSSVGTYINITQNQQLQLYFLYQAQLQKKDWYQGDSNPSDLLTHRYVYGISYAFYL